ncbi:MAG: Ribosome-recycling factor [Candidatus Anoxychlamydiales bacterium]|nr:Ribosome-recycling factor [Candidatus Anoxychlamydiales bacterium]
MNTQDEVKKEMSSTIEHFKEDLKNVRTSRASPSILDNLQVEVYGTNMKLRDLANVTVPESRQLLITPYDANNIHSIAKAIEAANLNLQPTIDGNVIRISIPPMDEQIRIEMQKKCKEKAENAKVKVREIRRKFNDQVRKQKQSGEIPEDIMKREEKMIQEMTDRFCKDIDCLCSAKEKEVLEV